MSLLQFTLTDENTNNQNPDLVHESSLLNFEGTNEQGEGSSTGSFGQEHAGRMDLQTGGGLQGEAPTLSGDIFRNDSFSSGGSVSSQSDPSGDSGDVGGDEFGADEIVVSASTSYPGVRKLPDDFDPNDVSEKESVAKIISLRKSLEAEADASRNPITGRVKKGKSVPKLSDEDALTLYSYRGEDAEYSSYPEWEAHSKALEYLLLHAAKTPNSTVLVHGIVPSDLQILKRFSSKLNVVAVAEHGDVHEACRMLTRNPNSDSLKIVTPKSAEEEYYLGEQKFSHAVVLPNMGLPNVEREKSVIKNIAENHLIEGAPLLAFTEELLSSTNILDDETIELFSKNRMRSGSLVAGRAGEAFQCFCLLAGTESPVGITQMWNKNEDGLHEFQQMHAAGKINEVAVGVFNAMPAYNYGFISTESKDQPDLSENTTKQYSVGDLYIESVDGKKEVFAVLDTGVVQKSFAVFFDQPVEVDKDSLISFLEIYEKIQDVAQKRLDDSFPAENFEKEKKDLFALLNEPVLNENGSEKYNGKKKWELVLESIKSDGLSIMEHIGNYCKTPAYTETLKTLEKLSSTGGLESFDESLLKGTILALPHQSEEIALELKGHPDKAFYHCLKTHGEVDIVLIANLCGKSMEDTKKEVRELGLAFYDPEEGKYVSHIEYFSGNIPGKIQKAEEEGYTENALALKNYLEKAPAPEIKSLQSVAIAIPEDILNKFISDGYGVSGTEDEKKLNFRRGKSDQWVYYENNKRRTLDSLVLNKDGVDVFSAIHPDPNFAKEDSISGTEILYWALSGKTPDIKNLRGKYENLTDDQVTEAIRQKQQSIDLAMENLNKKFIPWLDKNTEEKARIQDVMRTRFGHRVAPPPTNALNLHANSDFSPAQLNYLASMVFQPNGTIVADSEDYTSVIGKGAAMISNHRNRGKTLLVMPPGDIESFIEETKKTHPNLPVLSMTGGNGRNIEDQIGKMFTMRRGLVVTTPEYATMLPLPEDSGELEKEKSRAQKLHAKIQNKDERKNERDVLNLIKSARKIEKLETSNKISKWQGMGEMQFPSFDSVVLTGMHRLDGGEESARLMNIFQKARKDGASVRMHGTGIPSSDPSLVVSMLRAVSPSYEGAVNQVAAAIFSFQSFESVHRVKGESVLQTRSATGLSTEGYEILNVSGVYSGSTDRGLVKFVAAEATELQKSLNNNLARSTQTGLQKFVKSGNIAAFGDFSTNEKWAKAKKAVEENPEKLHVFVLHRYKFQDPVNESNTIDMRENVANMFKGHDNVKVLTLGEATTPSVMKSICSDESKKVALHVMSVPTKESELSALTAGDGAKKISYIYVTPEVEGAYANIAAGRSNMQGGAITVGSGMVGEIMQDGRGPLLQIVTTGIRTCGQHENRNHLALLNVDTSAFSEEQKTVRDFVVGAISASKNSKLKSVFTELKQKIENDINANPNNVMDVEQAARPLNEICKSFGIKFEEDEEVKATTSNPEIVTKMIQATRGIAQGGIPYSKEMAPLIDSLINSENENDSNAAKEKLKQVLGTPLEVLASMNENQIERFVRDGFESKDGALSAGSQHKAPERNLQNQHSLS